MHTEGKRVGVLEFVVLSVGMVYAYALGWLRGRRRGFWMGARARQRREAQERAAKLSHAEAQELSRFIDYLREVEWRGERDVARDPEWAKYLGLEPKAP